MTAKEIQKLLREVIKEVQRKRQELTTHISRYDLQEQDLLHCLEVEKCDAVQLVKISTRLKDIRLKRRVIKIEYEQLQSITDSWSSKMGSIVARNLDEFERKTYTYKTDAVHGIVHRQQGETVKPFKRN